MRWLNAQDDRWRCIESPITPFQIGALLLFDAAARDPSHFYEAARNHVAARLPATSLLAVHRAAPFGFDAGVWLDLEACDLDVHVRRYAAAEPVTRAELHEAAARLVMEPLDQDRPPFRIVVFDRVADGSLALALQIHHSLADGIGFQTIVGALTDPSPDHAGLAVARQSDERAPVAPLWVSRAGTRFTREAWARRRGRAERDRASTELAALRARPGIQRARTPGLGALSAPSSPRRAYDTLTLPLDAVRDAGRALGGTVNDIVLTLCGGALRSYLADSGELDRLGDAPLVAMVPRSRRRPEHGEMGNHLGLLLPQLGTHIADPRQRLAVVQASMRSEKERGELQDRITTDHDRPFGARRRRRIPEEGTTAGNVSISNVPGPAETRYLAGFRMTANYPMPTLPATQFANITLRRYREGLDFGVITDAAKVPAADVITAKLRTSFDEIVAAARGPMP